MSKVDKIVQKHLEKVVHPDHRGDIRDSALFREDLSVDSLGMISLFSNVIKDLELPITAFDDTELTNINSVGDLKSLFRSKLESPQRSIF